MLARVPIISAYDPRRESMLSYASPSNKIGLPPNKRYRLTPLARHKTRIDLGIIIFGMQFIGGSHNRLIR